MRCGDGKADAGVDPADPAQRLQVLEDQIALGDDVHREAELGDDLKSPPGQVDLRLQGHIEIVHRPQPDHALDALARQLLAQQFDGVDLDQHLAVEVLNLVALATAIAVDVKLLTWQFS